MICSLKFLGAVALVVACAAAEECRVKTPTHRLFCYYGDARDAKGCGCTHVILPQKTDGKGLERARQNSNGAKVLVTVNEFNEDLIGTLKRTKIDGLELDLRKLTSKTDIVDLIATVRTKLGADLYLALSVPVKAETLAKYYDLKALSKHTDVFILQTALLGVSPNVTFHPSRLSGIWDMQNTDSVVDLVTGLGAPLSKLAITAPVQAYSFELQGEDHTAPGSPALEVRSLTRDELCSAMRDGNWTLERDQDQAGPYVFKGTQWISFDDPMSIDIKAKYARVRGLSGLALKDVSQDGGEECGGSLLEAAHKGLSKQGRAPRAAVLHSLEREILEAPSRPLDTIQVSPYRISRIIDVEGNVHAVRQDTRTEFECSRQGYFVHPRSCGRFYRCVKFNQLSDDFNVFEFDCPAGLAFDSTVEVCVWPGSLKLSSACAGSSEIAPVPRQRFICPSQPGYYADPENCRWFFACLDHGKSPLSAYEFRCPFGLVFDESRLMCEWPWLVPKCVSGDADGFGFERGHVDVHGGGLRTFSLDQYDGLGILGVTPLGGLSGTFVRPVQKVYTTSGVGNLQYNQVPLVPTIVQGPVGQYQYYSGAGVSGGDLNSYNQASGLNNPSSNYVFHDSSSSGDLTAFNQGGYNSGALSNGAGFQLNHDAALRIAQNTANFVNHGFSSLSERNKIAPVTENINIIGGGYSAVGLIRGSDVEISQGSNIDAISSAIPAPVAYPTEGNVPVVSSVPLPNVDTYDKFEGYNGGVIANFPQLQYKVDAANGNYYQSNIFSNLANETLFVNYVSSTPAPEYRYQNADVAFVQGPVKIVSSTPSPFAVENVRQYSSAEGYNNQELTNVRVVSSTPAPTFADVINPVGFSGGYSYQNQHGVAKGLGFSTVTPGVSYYSYSTTTASPISPTLGEKVQFIPQSPAVNYVSGGYAGTGAISNSYFNKVEGRYHEAIQPVVRVTPQVTYSTVKPVVQFAPVTAKSALAIETAYTYPKPFAHVQENHAAVVAVTPSVATSYSYGSKHDQGYAYQKPVVATGYQTLNQGYTYQKAADAVIATGYNYESNPSVGYAYPKPAVALQPLQYSYQTNVDQGYAYQKPVESPPVVQGYAYPKPAVKFEEIRPVQPPVATYAYEYKQPVVSTPKPVLTVQPMVATSYSYESKHDEGYTYSKPTVKFEEVRPVVSTYVPPVTTKPVVVTSAPAVGYTYTKPTIGFEDGYAYSKQAHQNKAVVVQGYEYAKPAVVFQEVPSTTPKPAVVEQYVYRQPEKVVVSTPAPVIVTQGYEYKKPSVVFEERPVVGATYSYTSQHGYEYQKPAVVFEEQPVQPVVRYHKPTVVVSTTPAPVVSHTYQTAVVDQKSLLFEANKFADQQQQVVVQQQQQPVVGYSYPTPQVPFVEGQYENREPVYEEPFVAKKAYITGGKSVAVNPFKQYSQSVDTSHSYYINYNAATVPSTPVYSTTPAPTVYSTPTYAVRYSTTPTPVEYSTPKYEATYSTTPAPVVYSAPQYDVKYSTPATPTVYSTTPKVVRYQENYVASTPKPTLKSTIAAIITKKLKPYYYETTTQSRPIVRYYFGALDDAYQQKVVVPSTTYSPVQTTPSLRTYLPPVSTTSPPTTVKYVEEYLAPGIEVSTPANTYLPSYTSRPKVIVKQNDFHPLLPAKLGAQCTCASNNLKLRKPTEQNVLDVDDDGYDVKQIDQSQYGAVVESYEYEPQKIVEEVSVTPPSKSAYVVRKKVRVRPVSAPVFLEPSTEPSDREIADVVRKGLKLIKSAAKEGAKEAIENHVRLQGSVDCQRAGLFRHPSQCNKFYSCRWDCTKKKFTLHTFNCPVHLTFDSSLGACNWPSKGPACLENTLLPSD